MEVSQSLAGSEITQSFAAVEVSRTVISRSKAFKVSKFETMASKLPPGSPAPSLVQGLYNDTLGAIVSPPLYSSTAVSKQRFLRTRGALAYHTSEDNFTAFITDSPQSIFTERLVAQAEHGFFASGGTHDRWGFTRYGAGPLILGSMWDDFSQAPGGTWPAGTYTFIFVVMGGAGEILRWHVSPPRNILANHRVTLTLWNYQIADDIRVDCFAYTTDPTTAWYLGQMTKPNHSLIVDGLSGQPQRLHRMDDVWINSSGHSILQASAYHNGRFFHGGQTFSLSEGRGAVNLRWSDPLVNYTYGQDDNYLKVGDDTITFLASTSNGLYIFTPYRVYLGTGSFSPLLDDTRIELLPTRIGADNNQGDVDGDAIYVIFKGKVWRVRGGEEEEISAPLDETFTGLVIDKNRRLLYAYGDSGTPSNVRVFDLEAQKWSFLPITATNAFFRAYGEGNYTFPRFFSPTANWQAQPNYNSLIIQYTAQDCGEPLVKKAFDRILFRAQTTELPIVSGSIDGTPVSFVVAPLATTSTFSYYEARITDPDRVGYALTFSITLPGGSTPAFLYFPIEIDYTPREAIR